MSTTKLVNKTNHHVFVLSDNCIIMVYVKLLKKKLIGYYLLYITWVIC